MTATQHKNVPFDPGPCQDMDLTKAATLPTYLTERGHEHIDPWKKTPAHYPSTNAAPATVRQLKLREPSPLTVARRMLMCRKGLLSNEIEQLALSRKQQALQTHWRWHGKRIAALLLTGLSASITGSVMGALPILVTGYVIALSGLALGCRALAAAISMLRQPLASYYWREELPATPEEITTLSHLARQSPELHQFVTGWWNDPAPLRKRDVMMARDFINAMRVTSPVSSDTPAAHDSVN